MRILLLILITILLSSCVDIPTEAPESSVEFDTDDILNVIWNNCYTDRWIAVTTLDNRYLGYSIEQITEKIENWEKGVQQKQEPDYSDCDDLAISMMGLIRHPLTGLKGVPFGIAGLKYWHDGDVIVAHAVNIFIDSELRVWMYDPKIGMPSLELAVNWLGGWTVTWVMI